MDPTTKAAMQNLLPHPPVIPNDLQRCSLLLQPKNHKSQPFLRLLIARIVRFEYSKSEWIEREIPQLEGFRPRRWTVVLLPEVDVAAPGKKGVGEDVPADDLGNVRMTDAGNA